MLHGSRDAFWARPEIQHCQSLSFPLASGPLWPFIRPWHPPLTPAQGLLSRVNPLVIVRCARSSCGATSQLLGVPTTLSDNCVETVEIRDFRRDVKWCPKAGLRRELRSSTMTLGEPTYSMPCVSRHPEVVAAVVPTAHRHPSVHTARPHQSDTGTRQGPSPGTVKIQDGNKCQYEQYAKQFQVQ